MPFGLGASNSRRRRSNSTYVAPTVQSQSYGVALSAASHAAGYGQRSTSNNLSGLAAAAALKKHLVGGSALLTPSASRTNSLSNRTFRPMQSTYRGQQQQPAQQHRSQYEQPQQHHHEHQQQRRSQLQPPRANSLNSLVNGYSSGASPRKSLPQRESYARSSSMNSNTPMPPREVRDSSIAETTVTTRHGKDPNTIIKTTRQLGYDGRTKSLTKQTITKMGSFEVVKTTTIKPPINQQIDLVKPPSAPSAFYAGSLLSTGDSELENIEEEFDVDYYMEDDRFQAVEEEEGEEEEYYEEEDVVKSGEVLGHFPDPPTLGHSRVNSGYEELTQNNINQFNIINTTPNSPTSSAAAAVPIKSILKSKSPSMVNGSSSDQYIKQQKDIQPRKLNGETNGNESNSGDSVYSDAYDMLPSNIMPTKRVSNIPPLISRNTNDVETSSMVSAPKSAMVKQPRNNSMTSSTQKSVRIDVPTRVESFKPPPQQQQQQQQHYQSQDNYIPPKKHEPTQEEMYLKALEIAKQRVYGDRLTMTGAIDVDEGYNSDSSFTRSYPNNLDYRLTMKDRTSSMNSHSLAGKRAMSLTSQATRTMSGNSIYDYQQPQGVGFRSHSLRAQENPLTLVGKKTRMMDSITGRSPSMTNVAAETKYDKKWEKRQRKENMRLLEQERRDAVERAAEAAGLNKITSQNTNNNSHQLSQPQTSKMPKSSSRFSLFSKKSKKENEKKIQISDPILQKQTQPMSVDKRFPDFNSTSHNNNTNNNDHNTNNNTHNHDNNNNNNQGAGSFLDNIIPGRKSMEQQRHQQQIQEEKGEDDDVYRFKAFPYQASIQDYPIKRQVSNNSLVRKSSVHDSLTRMPSVHESLTRKPSLHDSFIRKSSIQELPEIRSVNHTSGGGILRDSNPSSEGAIVGDNYHKDNNMVDNYMPSDEDSNVDLIRIRPSTLMMSNNSPERYQTSPISPDSTRFQTPTLTMSNSLMGWNSTDRTTGIMATATAAVPEAAAAATENNIRQQDLDYGDYGKYESMSGYYELTAPTSQGGVVENVSFNSSNNNNQKAEDHGSGEKKKGKNRTKQFGKKVLKWFDIEE